VSSFAQRFPFAGFNALGCTVRPWRWLDGVASGPQRTAMPDAPQNTQRRSFGDLQGLSKAALGLWIGSTPSHNPAAGDSPSRVFQPHSNAVRKSAALLEARAPINSRSSSPRSIWKILPWPVPVPKDARLPGNNFSVPIAPIYAPRRRPFSGAVRDRRGVRTLGFSFRGFIRSRRWPGRCPFALLLLHGRSSLKTWLRAVLAQRHIDAIRAGRRFEELGEDDTQDSRQVAPSGPPLHPDDPHRERYLALFGRALSAALAELELPQRERLRLYYSEEKTLAEIGRLFGEHESSVSRHLDRVRRDLRGAVETILRRGLARRMVPR